jgi:hypothetical protein
MAPVIDINRGHDWPRSRFAPLARCPVTKKARRSAEPAGVGGIVSDSYFPVKGLMPPAPPGVCIIGTITIMLVG